MRRLLRIVIWVLVILIAAAGLGLVLVHRALRHVPEFYRQSLANPPLAAEQRRLGDKLEQQALQVRNDSRHAGRWQAVFTEEQLNAWLAVDLVQKFPHAMPREIRDPRVKIGQGEAQIGCTYEGPRIRTVISLTADVYLTQRPNEVAVRIKNLRAGRLPLPLSRSLEQIASKARDVRVDLTWSQQDADPVALIRVPIQHPEQSRRQVHLETVELREGQVVLAGRTE